MKKKGKVRIAAFGTVRRLQRGADCTDINPAIYSRLKYSVMLAEDALSIMQKSVSVMERETVRIFKRIEELRHMRSLAEVDADIERARIRIEASNIEISSMECSDTSVTKVYAMCEHKKLVASMMALERERKGILEVSDIGNEVARLEGMIQSLKEKKALKDEKIRRTERNISAMKYCMGLRIDNEEELCMYLGGIINALESDSRR